VFITQNLMQNISSNINKNQCFSDFILFLQILTFQTYSQAARQLYPDLADIVFFSPDSDAHDAPEAF
ncbi:MAG: hypothetical protein ABW185_00485, partial [Sedimenticola sp.]